VLVDTEMPAVEHFRRVGPEEWGLRVYHSMADSLPLPTLETELPLAEIYQDIVWRSNTAIPRP